MGIDRVAKNPSILVLLAAVTLAPGTAWAGGPEYPRKTGNDPSAGYSVPMPAAYPFSGNIVDPTCSTCSYTVPIVAVYQCPAVIAAQPGSQVVYLRSDSAYGLLGGQPYLYHRCDWSQGRALDPGDEDSARRCTYFCLIWLARDPRPRTIRWQGLYQMILLQVRPPGSSIIAQLMVIMILTRSRGPTIMPDFRSRKRRVCESASFSLAASDSRGPRHRGVAG